MLSTHFKQLKQYFITLKRNIGFSITVLCISFLNPLNVNAQITVSTPQDIETTLLKSKELAQRNMDSSFFYVKKAIKVSKLIKNDTLLAKAQLQISSLYILKKEFFKSDSLLQNNLSKNLTDYIKGQTLHNLGTIQYYKQDFKKALDFYVQASKLLERTNNNKQLVSTYSNIGAINASLKNYKNAQLYLERALLLSEFDETIKLQILINLSNVYHSQHLYKKYTKTIFEAEKIAEKHHSKNILSTIYTNLAMYFTDQGTDYDLAIAYGKKAILIRKELNNKNTLQVTYNNVGHAYLKKKEYQKAIKYLDSAIVGAKGIVKTYIYNNLKEAYSGLNQYKKAVYYADLKDKVKDSITNKQQKESVAELTEKYESEKKEQRINILNSENKLQALTIKQQKYLIATIFICTTLLFILGYFGFKNYKIKQQLDKILLQQKLKKTQLNPHFLFNALQSIQNFIYQNDKEKSNSYLTSYSKLIRLVLEKSDENFTTVEDDKITLQSYLNLQLLNYNNQFNFSVTVDDSVDEDFDMLPTLITQPFVENAVLHGLKNNKNGSIGIRYYKLDTVLYVSIIDNGQGFNANKEDSKKLHKSMSMDIIKEQLTNLNKSSSSFKGDISINNTPKRTEVILSFTTT